MAVFFNILEKFTSKVMKITDTSASHKNSQMKSIA
jgi:hypothetical protein